MRGFSLGVTDNRVLPQRRRPRNRRGLCAVIGERVFARSVIMHEILHKKLCEYALNILLEQCILGIRHNCVKALKLVNASS